MTSEITIAYLITMDGDLPSIKGKFMVNPNA